MCMYTHAEFLYCCPDCPSCPVNAIHIGWATWVTWAAIKKYSFTHLTRLYGTLDVYNESAVESLAPNIFPVQLVIFQRSLCTILLVPLLFCLAVVAPMWLVCSSPRISRSSCVDWAGAHVQHNHPPASLQSTTTQQHSNTMNNVAPKTTMFKPIPVLSLKFQLFNNTRSQ